MFDEHENGQLRLQAQGDQIPLLALPDAGIPAEGHEVTPAEAELERRAWRCRCGFDQDECIRCEPPAEAEAELERPGKTRHALRLEAEFRRSRGLTKRERLERGPGRGQYGSGSCAVCGAMPGKRHASPDCRRPAVTVDGLADGDEIVTSTGARLRVEAPFGRPGVV